ncbi:MAG: 3-dehydroquinate synthase [Ignavibacteriales bacterium]|nr:3-dehydroquinate synthase [Ignavibacteriales bacterium]
MAKTIKVKLSNNSYPVLIGNDSLDKVIEVINKSPISKCLLIIDKNVLKHHSMLIRKTFALMNSKVFNCSFTANEKNKSLHQVENIYKHLNVNSFDRNSIIVAIGGGITGDVAGYAASTYMRGIKFIQIPTTLLSMVDSSIGGKTGVNFNQKKNLIGTFYQPEIVAIYPEFLKTLPKRELLSGAGEIFKYSFLADDKNYKSLKKSLQKLFLNQAFNIEKCILDCLNIKANVVENDETEKTGLRKILNLGHTFAHAFEVASNYKLKHGEAVIGGIYCALFLSESVGYLSTEKLKKTIDNFSFIKPTKKLLPLNSDLIIKSMSNDKKSLFGKINFVLIEDVGKIVVDVVTAKSFVTESIGQMKALI